MCKHAGKWLSAASMELYSFVAKTFLKALFCSAPKWMKSRGRTTFCTCKEQQVNVDTGNKIFPGYCLIVLIWGRFLFPKQVWWPGPGSLCARPLSALLLLINGTERPGKQPGCPSGVEKSKTLFWPADSMYWFFVDEFFRCHPWQEKTCPCN